MDHGRELRDLLMRLRIDSLQGFQGKTSLMLWTLLIHASGEQRMTPTFTPVSSCVSSFANRKESKLMPHFLKKCKVLETQFRHLLSDTLQPQFEDFLMEKFSNVKNMNEAEFMRFMINERYGESYDDLIW